LVFQCNLSFGPWDPLVVNLCAVKFLNHEEGKA